jgi:hypothetical protein
MLDGNLRLTSILLDSRGVCGEDTADEGELPRHGWARAAELLGNFIWV